MTECWAGRKAFFGGRWSEPCPLGAIHFIANDAIEPIALCDPHFQQVNAAGLVSEPFLDPEEFDRRERHRKRP